MERAPIEHFGFPKKKKLDSNENEKFINYIKIPSLKSMALVAVAFQLHEFESCNDKDSAKMAGEKALRSLEELEILPSSIISEIKSILWPIEVQMISWSKYLNSKYGKYCDWKSIFKEKLLSYWDMHGIIDGIKFQKVLLDEIEFTSLETYDFLKLYVIACFCCHEENISKCFSKLPISMRKTEYYFTVLNSSLLYSSHLVAYWTAKINNELQNLMEQLFLFDRYNLYDRNLSICANMMSQVLVGGNINAIKYFWNYKLKEEEKRSNIKSWILLLLKTMKNYYFKSYEEGFNLNFDENQVVSWADKFAYNQYHPFTHILCFLLSQVSCSAEQVVIFQSNSKVILLSLFAAWPFHNFFLPTIAIMFNFLSENIYIGIMLKIAHIKENNRTRVLLKEVWDISPMNLKKAFICFLQNNAKTIVNMFFKRDFVMIHSILKVASSEEKRQIFFRMLYEPEFRSLLQSKDFSKAEWVVSAIGRLASKIAGNDLQ